MLATAFPLILAAVGVNASPAGKRLICSEAARFGVLQVVPSDLQTGSVSRFMRYMTGWLIMPQDFTVHVDFECAVEYFGIIPRYTDFWIEVPSGNNGHEPAILLARRDFTVPEPPLSPALTFTAQVRGMTLYFGITRSCIFRPAPTFPCLL